MGRAGVIADARDDLFVPVVAVVHPIGVIAYPDETLVARLFDGHVRGVAVETEGHVLRSLSVGHTARNQNFVSIGHLRVENFAAGVDVEALHDRIGRQLDEPAENDSIAQRRIDPRRVRGADRDADRASGVAGGRFGRYGRRTDVAARDDAPCIDRNRLRRRRAECHAQRVAVHVVCGVVRIAVVADAQRRAVGFAYFERFRCGFEREGRRGVGRFVSVRTVRSGEAEACCGEDQGAGHDE